MAKAQRTLQDARAKAKARHIEELNEHMEDVQVERARTEGKVEEPPPSGEASSSSSCVVEPPADFLCPITCELMEDPVSTVDGQVYERKAIEAWLALHDTSPNTGEMLPMKMLIPCVPLRGMIREFVERNGPAR